jgi:hypothetical protein
MASPRYPKEVRDGSSLFNDSENLDLNKNEISSKVLQKIMSSFLLKETLDE